MEKTIRVLLVDDHELVRRALRQMLDLESTIEVIGEASSAEEALSQVQLLSPDVVVMDVKMPGGSGLEAAARLQINGFPGKVLFISMYDGFVRQAVEVGAAGYLVKTAKLDEIVSAVRRVSEGELVFRGAEPKEEFPE